jgi:diguanylate cyclase (GGDEF)-like protein
LVVGIALLAGSIGFGVRDRSEKRRVTDQVLMNQANDEASKLEEYFARARAINLITAQNPSFRAFYAAPGDRVAKVKALGPAIRRAGAALAYLEKLYPKSIGEACFIDRAGPENARYVKGERAPFTHLSKDESGNPFFAPTFALRAGDVYQARPYVSPDTGEWVISNSTPLPGTGYPAAAIVHFEITLESFRRTAAAVAKHDDLAIVEARTGKVVVDSRFPQQRGSTLGRPGDRRFAKVVSDGTAAGTTSISGHRAAFKRLRRSQHNANDWYVVAVDRRSSGALLQDAGWGAAGMAVGALALLFLAAVSFRSSRRRRHEDELSRHAEAERAASERRYYEAQGEFTEIMQVTRDEHEAYRLLKRHLERSLEGSEVLVLNRNNSQNRLEPMTELDEGSPLAEELKTAEPDSCLAVRLGKTHVRSEDREPLLTCELCGCSSSNSTCVPSLVGGEVIGSVLVQHPSPLESASRRKVEESITQASPVLANLRNLALSQARALTDGLTGLPNRRAIEDTLKRMAAYAERTTSPLGAVLFDLDHFKQVNDLFGHEKGDEVLAAVGAVVSTTVRGSDFVGRYGGEEFILLLPDSDRDGASVIAEKVRVAISEIDVAGVSRSITASFGVAAIPEDAAEPTLLLRAVDRALYLAKAQGRNRVETLSSTDSEPLSPTPA